MIFDEYFKIATVNLKGEVEIYDIEKPFKSDKLQVKDDAL